MIEDPRGSREALEIELAALSCRVKGKLCQCPYHDDQSPSASILEAPGSVRVYCHVCGGKGWDVLDLREKRTGVSVADQLREISASQRPQARPAPPATAKPKRFFKNLEAIKASWGEKLLETFPYTNPETKIQELVVVRYLAGGTKGNGKPKKGYCQYHATGGGFEAGAPDGRLPIFNRGAIALVDSVLVVEGEHCAALLRQYQITATTSPCGAGKASGADWSPLRGKYCTLWPDNDEAGLAHMSEVAGILQSIGCRVAWIDPTGMGLGKGGDVEDLIDAMQKNDTIHDIGETLRDIIQDASSMDVSSELSELYKDIYEGKFQAIPWPGLSRVGNLSKACLPGAILTLCADPGAGKSLMMLQMMAGWHQAGISVGMLALEDERRMHLQRIHAQLANNSGLADDEYVRMNYETVKELLRLYENDLSQIGANIKAEGEDQMRLGEIAEWIENRMQDGIRIVIVDPVTAAVTEREPWAADTQFLMRVKRAARKFSATAILVTHPKGMAAKGPSLGSMAGGSAYPRFSHSAMWLEKIEAKEFMGVMGEPLLCNRVLKITKARHGRGGGSSIGLMFDSNTLRFTECGVVDLTESEQKQTTNNAKNSHANIENSSKAKERKDKLKSQPSDAENVF